MNHSMTPWGRHARSTFFSALFSAFSSVQRAAAIGVLGATATLGCATAPERIPATPASLAQGDVLAARMIEALGGQQRLDALQTISFDWVIHAGGFEVVRHHHDWDRRRGLHHFRSGDIDVVHVLGGEGIATEGGVVVTDPERHQALLAEAFQWWTNDTYWLMSPHKVMDAKTVRVAVDGDGDGDSDELRVSFDKVGLTPGDAYIYFFDDAGLPTSFRFALESGPVGDAVFVEKTELHGVTFHLRKIAGPAEIRFEHLEASRGPRDELFAALLASLGAASQPAPSAAEVGAASQPASRPAAASQPATSSASNQ